MRRILEGHPPVVAISRSCPVKTLRQYNLTQRRRERRGAKKRLTRAVIVQSYFGDVALVIGIPAAYNNLAHCQRNSGRADRRPMVNEPKSYTGHYLAPMLAKAT
jgi:hypothetical protein